ncbi:MAG: hypothetical protein EHM79_10365 [Geobacter sp.]|nr:MAG: hypothetical protein EHM79_10365 [Geobacter sp.]
MTQTNGPNAIIKICVVLFVVIYYVFGSSVAAHSQPKKYPHDSGKLLLSTDFVYLGAFRVPTEDMGGPKYQGLAYGGAVIAYNKTNKSLFIVGHDHNQQVAEISIPAPIKTANCAVMNTARVLQNLGDITEGNRCRLKVDRAEITDDTVKIGGLVIYGDKLIGSSFAYYDAGFQAVKSHFISGMNLSKKNDFAGMFEVGTKPAPVPQAGFVAGYMAVIPEAWQQYLGGKLLTGMSAISILSRTSAGPAAFAFDPDLFGIMEPVPATALLYYPPGHQTIGNYHSSKTLYNKGSSLSGVFFPSGTRSIIFTGRQGLGTACYGQGTNIPSEHGNRHDYPAPKNTCMGSVMTDTSNQCCYDPVNLTKGGHAYPYVDYAWAYDAYDLVRVKTGERIVDNPSQNLVDGVLSSSTETYKPWHIKPYATWQFDFPTTQQGYSISSGAASYDEINKRLYLVQVQTDQNRPIIHVFQVNTGR